MTPFVQKKKAKWDLIFQDFKSPFSQPNHLFYFARNQKKSWIYLSWTQIFFKSKLTLI